MENKINIANLLRDCPSGMELDCLMYEDVYFDYVVEHNMIHCYIQHETYKTSIIFNQYGTTNSDIKAKCVIFPKGKTTWEGFIPPCKFKDGDVVVAEDAESFQLFLLKHLTLIEDDNSYDGYCYFGWDFQRNELFEKGNWGFNRLATEEEKAKLFNAIEANGYRWNEKTKTLEKLPPFKVGECVMHHKYGKGDITKIIWVGNEIVYKTQFEHFTIYCSKNKLRKYELPGKFDITTLKPFDKVLVRCGNNGYWSPQFFAKYRNGSKFQFECTYNAWEQCIPYKGNEHLLGTTNDCDNYYKTWE